MSKEKKKGKGAPEGNQKALKKGFYSRVLDEAEMLDMERASDMSGIDDEIALLNDSALCCRFSGW